MHCIVKGADKAEAEAKCAASIAERARLAFDHGCRLAVNRDGSCLAGCCVGYEFVILSPGEKANSGWTIYEEREGHLVGRTV